MMFTARYGYVGLAVEKEEFVVEGINESGLSAGLFYFPSYGEYESYNEAYKESTVSDLQLVSWILSNFQSINDMKKVMYNIHIVTLDPLGSTLHLLVT